MNKSPGSPPSAPGGTTFLILGVVLVLLLACLIGFTVVGRPAPATAPPPTAPWPTAPPTRYDAPVQTPTAPPAAPTATETALTAPPVTPSKTAPPASATPPPEPECEVVSAGLNLRSGPGTAYAPPLALLRKGDRLVPLAQRRVGFPSGRWLLVRVQATGAAGWISAGSQYVLCNQDTGTLPEGDAPPTPTFTPVPSPIPTLPSSPTPTVDSPGNVVRLPRGTFPNGMAVDPDRGRLFIAGRDSDSLIVVDEATLSVVSQIPVGRRPFGVAYTSGYVYVANFGSASVSVVDAGTLQLTATLPTSAYGSEPTFLVPAGNTVNVVLHRSVRQERGALGQISVPSHNFYGNPEIGAGSFAAALLPRGRLLVSNRDSFNLVIVDTALTYVPVVGRSGQLAFSPYFVAASEYDAYVSHNTPGGPVDRPNQVTHYEWDDGVFVEKRTVTVGDLGDAGGWIAIHSGAGPNAFALIGTVWVSAAGRLPVFAPGLDGPIVTYGARDGLAGNPYAIVFSPARNRAYVDDGPADIVTVLDVSARPR